MSMFDGYIWDWFKRKPAPIPAEKSPPIEKPIKRVSRLSIMLTNGHSLGTKTLEWREEWKDSTVLPWRNFIRWYFGRGNRPFVQQFRGGITVLKKEHIVSYTIVTGDLLDEED